METRFRRWLVVAGATAVMSLALTAGGTGLAGAFNVPNNSVTGAKVVNGSLTGADVRDGSLHGRDIRNGTVFADDLAPAIRPMWARIDTDANLSTLLSGRNVAGTAWGGSGLYTVTFDRPITGCGWIATWNGPVGQGEIAVDPTSATTLTIRLYTSTGGVMTNPPNGTQVTVMALC